MGGLSSGPSAIESRALHEIRQWSYDCGLTISSIKPHRNGNDETFFREIMFNVSCRGSMDSVGQFLWRIENSKLPLRITEFQLGAREEDGQNMSLQLKLSTVYLPENTPPDSGYVEEIGDGGNG